MAYVCLYKFSVPIGLYGFQHYMSMLGSLILIPLVIVPAMGGTYVSSYNFYNIYLFCKKSKEFCGLLGLIGFSGFQEDTSNVVSTVLFVSGVTTLLHTSFGSRLPLIQGPSFVFLAPALAIINSPEFQGLNQNVSSSYPALVQLNIEVHDCPFVFVTI